MKIYWIGSNMYLTISFLCAILFTGTTSAEIHVEEKASTSNTAAAPKIQDIFSDYFQWRMKDMPQHATNIGIHDYDEFLNDLSEEAYYNRYKRCEEYLQKINDLEADITDEVDKFNLKILKFEVETFIKYFHLKGFYLQMSQHDGSPVEMARTFEYMHRKTYNDYDRMIQRMQKIPRQFDQVIDIMKAGVENDITFHKYSLKNMKLSLGKFIVRDAELSPLFSFFKGNFPESLTQDQITTLQNKAKDVILTAVVPAYRKLLDFILLEYVPREDIAITSIKNGDKFYKGLIEFHTGTNYTAEEIQNIGYKEIARIEHEMEKVIAELGYKGMSRKEFSKLFREDPKNFFNSSDEMMERINYIVHELVPPRISNIFNTIPKTELIVRESPSKSGSLAYHVDGSIDGERSGAYYINTYDLNLKSKYALLSLSLHEGNPGHHLQGSYINENKNFPFFRRYADHSNYGIFPSMFPVYAYYVEGWGLYAESLGFDLGLYDNPLDRYGHYSEEIFRAVRLVVDTGIHGLGWTREKAINYMYDLSESSRQRIESEIDRYITKPGQALSYKMGEIRIKGLRAKAEKELGKKFHLKDFHSVILDSYGPMDFVQEEVEKWIAKTLSLQ